MSFVYEDKCKEFGLDPKKVASIARRISKASREADEMGLIIFGGMGTGELRYGDAPMQGPGHSVVADLEGCFDGGDGADVF